jgi:hypothetical protein
VKRKQNLKLKQKGPKAKPKEEPKAKGDETIS